MLSVACWSAWIINSSFKAYFLFNWHVICIIVKHFGHIFDFLRQIWPEQRLRAQHARMLHAGQPNTFVHVTYQNTGNLMCWFHFRRQKYFFGNIPPPQLTCIGLCAHVLCSKRAIWRSNVYFDLENEISNLNYLWKDISLVKNVPGWPSWLWAHARTHVTCRSKCSNCIFKVKNEISYENYIKFDTLHHKI